MAMRPYGQPYQTGACGPPEFLIETQGFPLSVRSKSF